MTHFSHDQIDMVTHLAQNLFQVCGYVVENCPVESSFEGPRECLEGVLSPQPELRLESMSVCRDDCSAATTASEQSMYDGTRLPSHVFLFNVPPDVRQDDVQFGRKFTDLRKSLTDNDCCPFDLKPLK